MSRRTQLTTKFLFQVLSQLSENFIFIYLGLSLFTEPGLDFRPLFILVTVGGICIARGLAVFPLSRLINLVLRYRARRLGREEIEELSFQHQAMLFWAGLRGAVGVALAAGLSGPNSFVLRATVLIVVVLTVIIFGGTTARMLEILGIRTGVQDEPDSDDEFDIEVIPNGTYGRKTFTNNTNYDYYNSKKTRISGPGIPLSHTLADDRPNNLERVRSFTSGNSPQGANAGIASPRRNTGSRDDTVVPSATPLLDQEYEADLDLPPQARRPQFTNIIGNDGRASSAPQGQTSASDHPTTAIEAAGGLRHFLSEGIDDPAQWFRKLDEELIKPSLLLNPGDGGHGHGHHGGV
jgi:sodium/hydrogen exchanger-like protein 6/7